MRKRGLVARAAYPEGRERLSDSEVLTRSSLVVLATSSLTGALGANSLERRLLNLLTVVAAGSGDGPGLEAVRGSARQGSTQKPSEEREGHLRRSPRPATEPGGAGHVGVRPKLSIQSRSHSRRQSLGTTGLREGRNGQEEAGLEGGPGKPR